MKNGASSLLWFASLQFPFHSVQAVVCARHCENTLTIFSGFEDLFSYVLNLIFFSFFSIKVVQRFQLFFFPFLFSSWCICRHTVSLVSKMWCIMHVFSSGLEWEEQQRDGELWEVIYSKERPLMTMLTDHDRWWRGWRGWDSEKNVRFLSSRSLNEEQSFCFLQWWVIWSTSHCMKKFAILIKISSLSTNHYKILMKIGRFRFPVWIFVSFHFYAHLQNHITMKGQLALSPQKVTE